MNGLKLIFSLESVKFIECQLFDKNEAANASAQRSPSLAAETIPPAYPAPSPQGYKSFISVWVISEGSRGILTGDEVRVSTPIIIASLVKKPLAYLPKISKPLRRRILMNCGNHLSMRDSLIPGAYDVRGRSVDALPMTKSSILCAPAFWVQSASSKHFLSKSS